MPSLDYIQFVAALRFPRTYLLTKCRETTHASTLFVEPTEVLSINNLSKLKTEAVYGTANIYFNIYNNFYLLLWGRCHILAR